MTYRPGMSPSEAREAATAYDIGMPDDDYGIILSNLRACQEELDVVIPANHRLRSLIDQALTCLTGPSPADAGRFLLRALGREDEFEGADGVWARSMRAMHGEDSL